MATIQSSSKKPLTVKPNVFKTIKEFGAFDVSERRFDIIDQHGSASGQGFQTQRDDDDDVLNCAAETGGETSFFLPVFSVPVLQVFRDGEAHGFIGYPG